MNGFALATFRTGVSRTLPSHRTGSSVSSVSFAMLKHWEGNKGETLLLSGHIRGFMSISSYLNLLRWADLSRVWGKKTFEDLNETNGAQI